MTFPRNDHLSPTAS